MPMVSKQHSPRSYIIGAEPYIIHVPHHRAQKPPAHTSASRSTLARLYKRGLYSHRRLIV